MRAVAKALGGPAEREVVGVKKRVLSTAGRAAIVKAAKKRRNYFELPRSEMRFSPLPSGRMR